jgi:hypothetical protein
MALSAVGPGGGLAMSVRRRIPALLGPILVIAIGLGLAMGPRPLEQPIAFNHRLHVEEMGAECTDCHLYALSGVRATIPNIAVCADCHEEAQGESAAEAKLVEYIQAGEPIPWVKVTTMPDHVYFSHRRHAAIAGIECDTCHGPVGQRSEPVVRPAVDMSMDYCMDCHEASGASNDCIWCHY